jgi:hypothetical protein
VPATGPGNGSVGRVAVSAAVAPVPAQPAVAAPGHVALESHQPQGHRPAVDEHSAAHARGGAAAEPAAALAQAAQALGTLKAVGPVALAGPALKTTVTRQSGKVVVSVVGVQILGWFCETIPRSPNPDPKLFHGAEP